MRQVGRDEVIYLLASALCSVSPSLWAQASDRRREVRDRGRALIATAIADRLARLEILSSQPDANTSFKHAIANMLGEQAGPIQLIE